MFPKTSLVSFFIGVAFLVASSLMTTNVLAQAQFDCEQLVGTWIGEHQYEDGRIDQWEAIYAEDRAFDIRFFNQDGEEVGRQTGSWSCDGLWVTSTTSEAGQEYVFEYQIRSLDAFRYQYESAQGPLFTSYRKTQ